MLEPLLEKLEKKQLDINQLDNTTRKMIEEYKKNKDDFDKYLLQNGNSNLDLIEEEESEEEEFEEESIEIPEEYYDSKNKNIQFAYCDEKIMLTWNLDLEIKYKDQTINYKNSDKILELISPEFHYIVEFFIEKYNIYQKIDSNIKLSKDIEEIKQDIKNIKVDKEKYPRFNKFFNVPEEDQVKTIDKKEQNKIDELFNKIDNITKPSIRKVSLSKNRKANTKTKNKK